MANENYSEQLFIDRIHEKYVAIYLNTGVKLKGKILAQDDYTILLSGKGTASQMIYKNAIASLAVSEERI